MKKYDYLKKKCKCLGKERCNGLYMGSQRLKQNVRVRTGLMDYKKALAGKLFNTLY